MIASSSKAASRTLEIKVLSAEDLTIDRKPVTKNVFVEVRAETLNCATTSYGAAEGVSRGSPTWNETLMVEVPAHARSITFDVKCKTKSMGTKSLGIARIGLSEFLGGMVPEYCLQFLSYRLRDWEGRRNGIVNFSVRVKSAAPAPAVRERRPCGIEVRGDEKNPSGVVTGVPVWWTSQHMANP